MTQPKPLSEKMKNSAQGRSFATVWLKNLPEPLRKSGVSEPVRYDHWPMTGRAWNTNSSWAAYKGVTELEDRLVSRFTTPWQRMNSIRFGDDERLKHRALEQASVLFSAN